MTYFITRSHRVSAKIGLFYLQLFSISKHRLRPTNHNPYKHLLCGAGGANVARLLILRPILGDNGNSYLKLIRSLPASGNDKPTLAQTIMDYSKNGGPQPTAFLSRGNKDSDPGGYAPESFHAGKVIMMLLSPVFVSLQGSRFFFCSSPAIAFHSRFIWTFDYSTGDY